MPLLSKGCYFDFIKGGNTVMRKNFQWVAFHLRGPHANILHVVQVGKDYPLKGFPHNPISTIKCLKILSV